MTSSTLSLHSSRNADNGPKLQRKVGALGGVSFVAGTMIGSGIFISPTGVMSASGSVGSALIIWALCGVIAFTAAFSHVELALIIHEPGAMYSYCNRAYGGVVGFICIWTSVILLKPASLAVITMTFAQYACVPFFPGCSPPDILKKCIAIIAIMLVSTLNGISVKLSERVQIVFMGAKLIVLSAIAVTGLIRIAQGETDNFNDAFVGTTTSITIWSVAIYNGMWSYESWFNISFLSQELKNPVRTIPISLLIAIPLVTICYLLVNIAYFTVMTADELMASNAVAITYGDAVFGKMAWIVPIGVAFSTFGSANGSVFTSARLAYAASQNGHMPAFLSHISHSRSSPLVAVAFNCCIGILMVIPESSSIQNLLAYFAFSSWLIHSIVFLSIVVMRFRKPMSLVERKFKIWLPLPIMCSAISIYLAIGPIIEKPSIVYLLVTAFMFSGLLLYIPFVHLKLNIPFNLDKKMEKYIQQFFEVVPVKANIE